MWGAGGRLMSMRGSHMYGYGCTFIFVFASRGGNGGGAFQLITLSFLLCVTPLHLFFHFLFFFFLKGALHQSSLPPFKVKTILLIKHCVIATIISGFRQSKHNHTHLNLQWAPKNSVDRQAETGWGRKNKKSTKDFDNKYNGRCGDQWVEGRKWQRKVN